MAFEVAVYTVTDEQVLAERHHEVHDRLRGYDGFVSSLALRRVDALGVFADVVLWRDLAAAKAAAAAIGNDPELAWFGRGIEELSLFTHFTAATDIDGVVERLRAAPLVELAAYRPPAPGEHARLHRLLHRTKLRDRDGVLGAVALTGGEDGLVGDLIGWASRDAWEATGAAMAADPDLAGFFDPAEHTAVFALFTHSVAGSA